MFNSIGSGAQLSDVYQDKNDKPRLFRKQNGFSPDQILKAKTIGNEIREKALTDKIEQLTKEENAIVEADQHIRKLLDAAKALSNPTGVSTSIKKNAFGSRFASLSSPNSALDANNTVLVTPSFGTPEGSFSIKIDRVATKDKTTGSAILTSKATNITANETHIYIRGTKVKVPANATLDEIVDSINAKKSDTHTQAFARKFSNTDYRIFINNSKEGEKITLETIANKLTEPFTSSTDPLGLGGTLVIGGEEKIITPTMNLTDIATLISTVQTFLAMVVGSAPSFTLDVTENATPVVLTDVATEKLMIQLGLSESNTSATDLQAQYYLDGNPTPILSPTNHIEGQYEKATIDLLAPSSNTEITATINRDPAEVLSSIEELINAYNNLITFTKAQTEKDPQNNNAPKKDAYLAKNRQFINMVDRIKQEFSTIIAGVATGLNHINELGIQKDRDSGLLVTDETKLRRLLDGQLEDVEQVFAFTSQNTTGGYFKITEHPKRVPPTMFGKNVGVSVTKNAQGTYSARFYLNNNGVISDDISLATGDANIKVNSLGFITITGPKDTMYEGFEFDYFGPAISTPEDPATVIENDEFKLTQGLGDFLAKKLTDVVLLPTNNANDPDPKNTPSNELNKISFSTHKERTLQEKKLKALQEKNARAMKFEKRRAERFQKDMGKVQDILSAFTPMMMSMFGR